MPTDHRPVALIVDDEADIRELLEITLSRMGVDTPPPAARSPRPRAARSASFDLCLTDMRLPDGDGIELVRTSPSTIRTCRSR
jgi:two-component system response regulator PilR (NtrC family)